MTDSTIGRGFITRRHCHLLLTAAVMTYLLITMGGVVCVTESAEGCPDWPRCYGQIVPPPRMDAIIEYTHRLIAALTSPFIIAAALVGWQRSRAVRWVSRPPLLAVVCLFAVIVFGALAVLRGLSPVAATLDLGLALMVLALLLTALVVAFARHHHPALPDRLLFRSPFARLTLGALVAVFITLVSGVLVAESGSVTRCLGWPLYDGGWEPVDLRAWLQVARLLVAGVASVLVVAVVVQAWRTQRGQAAISRVSALVGGVLLTEVLVGALMLVFGSAIFLLVVDVIAAAALWALLVVLAVLVGLAPLVPTMDRENAL